MANKFEDPSDSRALKMKFIAALFAGTLSASAPEDVEQVTHIKIECDPKTQMCWNAHDVKQKQIVQVPEGFDKAQVIEARNRVISDLETILDETEVLKNDTEWAVGFMRDKKDIRAAVGERLGTTLTQFLNMYDDFSVARSKLERNLQPELRESRDLNNLVKLGSQVKRMSLDLKKLFAKVEREFRRQSIQRT